MSKENNQTAPMSFDMMLGWPACVIYITRDKETYQEHYYAVVQDPQAEIEVSVELENLSEKEMLKARKELYKKLGKAAK